MENATNVQHSIYLEYPVMTSKEVRKLGKDLGYGVTMGVFSAVFTVNVVIGIMKAVRKHFDKKADSASKEEGCTVEFKDDEEESSEA